MKVNRLLLFLLVSCFPETCGDKPVKMMLCLPCPPPAAAVGNALSSAGGAGGGQNSGPRDYTYRCESRELRGGNLYSSCQCAKRNGLQHDCPRTPCQGRPACLTKPWPDCWPSGGSHGIDFTREIGMKKAPPGGGGYGGGGGGEKAECGANMMVVVCPPPS